MIASMKQKVDALVVGGGIAGLQAALDLADQDYQVLVVEKSPSIGGRMIALSKVFPTLDCASCITTPKMSAASRHKNITLMTDSEVLRVEAGAKGAPSTVTVRKNPRFVDLSTCIGCSLCEYACPVERPDPFEWEMGATKAIAVPFTNAIPPKAVLDPAWCTACGACAAVCPTDAIDFAQRAEEMEFEAGTVIMASGFDMNATTIKPQYRAAESSNVLNPLQLERLLAPHGPYGRVVRPSDGKVPDNIAFVLCAGSRDKSIGVSYCSRVCCMYSIKQAMLLSGAVPMAEITIYYMDIRAFGKGYEQFFQNAKAMGIHFTKGKVARLDPVESGNLQLRVESLEDGRLLENRHDLVILAQGIIPRADAGGLGIALDHDGFMKCPDPVAPTHTAAEGVFAAGCVAGPKDIVDTIVEASAAASEASQHLLRTQQPATGSGHGT
jgi:heterodisulfide reductase subunit A